MESQPALKPCWALHGREVIFICLLFLGPSADCCGRDIVLPWITVESASTIFLNYSLTKLHLLLPNYWYFLLVYTLTVIFCRTAGLKSNMSLLCYFVRAVTAIDPLSPSPRCSSQLGAVCGIGGAQCRRLFSRDYNCNSMPRFPRQGRWPTSYVETQVVCIWSCSSLSLLLFWQVGNEATAWPHLFPGRRRRVCRPHGPGTQSNSAADILCEDK